MLFAHAFWKYAPLWKFSWGIYSGGYWGKEVPSPNPPSSISPPHSMGHPYYADTICPSPVGVILFFCRSFTLWQIPSPLNLHFRPIISLCPLKRYKNKFYFCLLSAVFSMLHIFTCFSIRQAVFLKPGTHVNWQKDVSTHAMLVRQCPPCCVFVFWQGVCPPLARTHCCEYWSDAGSPACPFNKSWSWDRLLS